MSAPLHLAADMFKLWSHGYLFGVRCQQAFSAVYLLERLLNKHHFPSMIELGSGHGALSVYLAVRAVLHGQVLHTVELYPRGLTTGGTFETGTLLAKLAPAVHVHEADATDPAVLAKLATATNAPRLWLCDGGDKPKEVQLVADLAHDTDIIMAHDYGAPGDAVGEIGDSRIPKGWQHWQPWQAQADSVEAKWMLLSKL